MTQNRDNSQAKKTFEGQRNNEDVLFLFRRHILVAKKGFFLFLIFFFLFTLSDYIITYFYENVNTFLKYF